MRTGWINALAVVSAQHEAEFVAALEEVVSPDDATIAPYPCVRVHVPDADEEILLLLALRGCGQNYRTGPGRFAFPAEWESEVGDVVALCGIRASVVTSVGFRLELRSARLLDDLRASLRRRQGTFGPTYPSVTAARRIRME